MSPYPSMNSNGNTFDYSSRQISFCHGSRDVRRYEHDGSVTVLAAKNDEGKEFNAPNDGMVHPNDGAIWFTDPGYGALMNYEGKRYSTDNVQPFIMGGRRLRRCAHLCARRYPYRPDPSARDLRQRLLWREQAQSPVHGSESVTL